MSRTDRDKRGGHPHPKHPHTAELDCGCCETIPRPDRDPTNRARRERWAMRIEEHNQKE